MLNNSEEKYSFKFCAFNLSKIAPTSLKVFTNDTNIPSNFKIGTNLPLVLF